MVRDCPILTVLADALRKTPFAVPPPPQVNLSFSALVRRRYRISMWAMTVLSPMALEDAARQSGLFRAWRLRRFATRLRRLETFQAAAGFTAHEHQTAMSMYRWFGGLIFYGYNRFEFEPKFAASTVRYAFQLWPVDDIETNIFRDVSSYIECVLRPTEVFQGVLGLFGTSILAAARVSPEASKPVYESVRALYDELRAQAVTETIDDDGLATVLGYT